MANEHSDGRLKVVRERLKRPDDAAFSARTVLRLTLLVGVASVVTVGVIVVIVAALTQAVGFVA